jgi:hypothetical protein
LLLLVLPGISSGLLFSWLWQSWLLFAIAISAFLLMSGGLLLSLKHPVAHAVALGGAAGAFIGSLVGVSRYISG